MNKILLIILLFSFAILKSQQAYIIPDIAAPGMNVYYEIIGVHDQKDFFGSENFYLNNPGDQLRVLPTNLNDTNKITFGPIHVSWSGRMISGQVFVNPNVQPNSWDWSVLNPQWIIPIEVIKNGNPLPNLDLKIYIVNPFTFGNQTANSERILGEGTLGKRSPRGAMIVDSMILAPDNYSVSTNDCDPVLSGNQAFLPFVLLSNGNIRGSAGTTISVNANGRHAGPGGGGGGGRFADNTTGTTGGDGFTGGGNGGTNFIAGGGSYENAGFGSGSIYQVNISGVNYGGSSINGVLGAGCNVTSYESSGGGTGHPFGKSGFASWHPCTVCEGGIGGASGNNQNGKGASGGYATSALDETPTTSSNGGKAHGNIYGVPFAGGSGGGSGNPQGNFPTFVKSSGWGGGGGGAIRVFATNIENLKITADGAEGQSGSPDGGSGSGGMVEVGTKDKLSNISVSAARGSDRAGYGRFRFDTRANFPTIDANNDASQIVTTITTEKKDFVKRTFTLNVKKNLNQAMDYYIKPENGAWQQLFTFNDLSQTTRQFNIDFTAYTDTIFYGMAVQSTISDGSESDYSHIPEKILSQSSGNVFRIAEIKLFTEQPRRLYLSSCNQSTVYDTLFLKNNGSVYRAEIDTDNHSWDAGDNGFVLLFPSVSTLIEEKDSTRFIVRFDYTNGQTGQISNTLTVPYGENRTNIDKEYKIEYIVDIDNLNVEWQRQDNSVIQDTLELDLCINETFAETIQIQNNSTIDFTVDDLYYEITEDDYTDLVYLNEVVQIGNKFNFQLGFDQSPPQRGTFFNKIYLKVLECDNIVDSLILKINVKESFLEQTNGLAIVDFGNLNIVQDKIQNITIKNNGNTTAYIPNPPIINLPFEYVSTNLTYPISLAPNEQMVITIRFNPTDEISYEEDLEIIMTSDNGNCDQIASFKLIGQGIKSNLVFSTPLDWGYVEWCESRPDSNIVITNNANFPVTIIGSHTITGINPENWSISNNVPTNGTIINPNGGSINFDIKYDPSVGPDGPKSAILKIPTDDVSLPTEDDPNVHLIIIDLLAYKEGLDVTFDPDPIIDFGNVPINTESIRIPVTITNNSPNSTRVLNEVRPSNFKLYNGVNQSFAPGESKTIELTVQLSNVGDYTENIEFIFDRIGCTTTYTSTANAFGIRGDANINPNSLDFGVLTKCQKNESLTFSISNDGDVDIQINDITISGNDANLFQLDPFQTNQTISSSFTQKYTLNFNPIANNYGTFTSNLIIEVVENGVTNTYSLPVTSEVSKGIGHQPYSLDFGQVVSTLSKTEIINLDNLHNWTIQFDDLLQLNSSPIFNIDDNIYDNILMNNPQNIEITFTPPVIGNYTDTLFIPYTIDGICQDTIMIELIGEGLPSSELTLTIPPQNINPALDRVEIPIYAQITNGNTNVPILNFDTLKVRMDKTTFYPENLSKGDIVSLSYPTPNEFELVLNIPNIQLSENSNQITSISAVPLLGERKNSLIEMSGAILSPNGVISTINYINSNVELEICEEGGERLLSNTLDIDLSLTLSNSLLQIFTSVIEAGINKIEVLDITGQILYQDEWVREFNGSNNYNFEYHTDKLTSGLYFIRLTTPNDVITKKLILTK